MYGLVLEGGGARGAFQVGAWKAMREIGIEIEGISGTSVGALNGAIIIQNEFEKSYDIWYNMCPSRVMNVEDKLLRKLVKLDITPDNVHYIIKQLSSLLGGKGIDITPLKELLAEHIDEDKIRKSPMDFGIVTISLSDRKPLELFKEDIAEGELIKYLLASANLPVFKLEKVDDKLYLDGGFYDNLPIRLLLSKGYRDLIVVRLNALGRIRKVREDGLNITYVNPSEHLGMALDFTMERARYNLKLGYYDTLKTFRNLMGEKYYIEPKNEDDYFIHFFMNLDEEKVLKIGEIIGVKDMPYRRMLFEYIIPKLGDFLDIGRDCSYEEIVIALFERVADRIQMERFKVYNYDDFMDETLSKFKPSRKRISERIPGIFKHSDLILRSLKNNILDEIIDVIFSQ